jgi:hypothetical protein
LVRIVTVVFGLLVVIGPSSQAFAQSGWPSWPWSNPEPRREQRPQPLPSGPPPQGYPQAYPPGQQMRPPPPGQRPASADGMSAKERFCYQLEQKLVQTTSQGSQARDQLPRIEQDMRQLDKVYQQSRAQLERSECFEYFLFAKSLKKTRQCYDLNKQVEESRQRLADLEAQKQSIQGSRGAKAAQDEIIDALGRNGCGANYQQEAARRDRQSGSGFPWQGDDEDGEGSGGMRRQGQLPFSTFRTVCVRLCDGYYFPVSFSTMQSQFPKDAQACSSKCAAPTELFYYQNPGGEMEQAQSVAGQPYSKLPNAFRHRKEVVQGCSCKVAEYQPELLGQKGQKRAEPAVSAQPSTSAASVQTGTPGNPSAPVAVIGAPVKRAQAKTPAGPAGPSNGGGDDLIAQTIERSRQGQAAGTAPAQR